MQYAACEDKHHTAPNLKPYNNRTLNNGGLSPPYSGSPLFTGYGESQALVRPSSRSPQMYGDYSTDCTVYELPSQTLARKFGTRLRSLRPDDAHNLPRAADQGTGGLYMDAEHLYYTVNANAALDDQYSSGEYSSKGNCNVVANPLEEYSSGYHGSSAYTNSSSSSDGSVLLNFNKQGTASTASGARTVNTGHTQEQRNNQHWPTAHFEQSRSPRMCSSSMLSVPRKQQQHHQQQQQQRFPDVLPFNNSQVQTDFV